MIPVIGRALNRQRRFAEVGLLLPFTARVRLIGGRATRVRVDAHESVAVIAVYVPCAARSVHGDLVVVHAQAIALGVAIREETPLQHLVGRETDARHDVGRCERCLLDIGEMVLGIPVQFHHANLDERIVAFRPDLGQVERVDVIAAGVLLRHDLYGQCPARKIAALDRFVKVAMVRLAIAADQRFSLGVRQVFDSLLRAEMELDPIAFVLRIDKAVRVASESVHMTESFRNASLAHHDRDLMQCFRKLRPEVPVAFCAAQTRTWIALDCMVQVGKFKGIAQEKDRCVVAHQIPVAFLGIELEREAANVAFRVGRAAFAGNSRETGKHLGLLADSRKNLCPRVLCDVVRDGERAERA